MEDAGRRWLVVGVGCLLLTWPLTGCGGEPKRPLPQHAACDGPVRAELGPVDHTPRPTTFTTSGGDLYFGMKGDSGGVFGPITQSLFSFGPTDLPPRFDTSNTPTNARFSITVERDGLTKVSLPAGDYWVTSSNSTLAWAETCSPVTLEVIHVHKPSLRG